MGWKVLAAIMCVAVALPAWAEIRIDGVISTDEWRGARHVTEFVQVQPMTGEPSGLPTEAWVKATPGGLAVAFRCLQPPGLPRTTQIVKRDFHASVDRVNLMVDFNGDGRIGYNFTLSSTDGIADAVISQTGFSDDWDSLWLHAVKRDDAGYTAEMLVPWYIAPMHAVENDTRTIGVYLDRVTGATGERIAWPFASFERPRFLADFVHMEVPAYSQSLLAIMPYVSGLYDNVAGDSAFQAGVDLFWKPNGQFQLTATLNPDFGQVESDELVVNFSAEESFFSDKRPFFTENQGIFDFGLLIDNSQLIYTRRVGGPADDGSGAGDIAGALKLNGSFGSTNYGVMAAEERGNAGRSFRALRLNHDFGTQTLGVLATQVERPFFDRRAEVIGVDYQWQPSESINVLANAVGSRIARPGNDSNGSGATLVVDWEMNQRWRQQWLAMHFGDSLEINDFGYLARNNMNYAHWQVSMRRTDLPEDSAYAAHDWLFRIIGINTDHGLAIQRQLRVVRESDRRDGGNEHLQFNWEAPAYADRLTRGHGVFRVPGTFKVWWDRESPRHGNWAWEVDGHIGGAGGLAGNERVGYSLSFEPTFFFSDSLSAHAGLEFDRLPGWLVWQHDNLIGSFDKRALEFEAGLDWYLGDRQELRVKLQAIGLDAEAEQAYRVANDRALAVDESLEDFSVRNLGFQVRYRYQLAPLSWVYVVYGRGGFALDLEAPGAPDLLGDSFDLRDDEQFLVKLNYRFTL